MKPSLQFARLGIPRSCLTQLFGLVALPLIAMGLFVFLAFRTAAPASANDKVTPEQCRNSGYPVDDCTSTTGGTWTGGNLNASQANYTTGMGTWQRMFGTNSTGLTVHNYYFGISWSDKTGGIYVHDYDFMVSWAQAITLAQQAIGQTENPNPCDGYSTSGALSDFTICQRFHNGVYYSATVAAPDDPFCSTIYALGTCNVQDRLDAFEKLYGNRLISVYADAPISGASIAMGHQCCIGGAVVDSTGTNTEFFAYYTVTITTTTASANTMLEFAAHVAIGNERFWPAEIRWGQNIDPGALSGASYHIKFINYDAAGGSIDNQLALVSGGVPEGLTTSSSPVSVTIGASPGVTDTAVITAVNGSGTLLNVAGTVTFTVCQMDPYVLPNPGTCYSGPGTLSSLVHAIVFTNTQTLASSTNATVSSAAFIPQTIGRYCWNIDFGSSNAPTIYSKKGLGVDNGAFDGTLSTASECFDALRTTAVGLSSFEIRPIPRAVNKPGAVSLQWATASEINTAGFNVYRSEKQEGPYVRVNADLIPAAANAVTGNSYTYEDKTVLPGRTYYYELEDVALNGTGTRHPAAVVAVPAVMASEFDQTPFLLGLGAGTLVLGALAGTLYLLRRRRTNL
ncbi:MAG: hypothetical protein WCF84_00655 [Anaerolineae bacterium]